MDKDTEKGTFEVAQIQWRTDAIQFNVNTEYNTELLLADT